MSVSTQLSDTATTSTSTSTSTSEAGSPPLVRSRRRAPLLAAVMAGLALAATGLVVLVLQPRSGPVAHPADLSAYARGGSVYSEQVPAAEVPWTTAYGPGRTVYREQVPSNASESWTTAFGTGSTTYREQVPSPDRR